MTMALLKDKVILISGGTQGLGAGVARRAAEEGAAGIAITGRNADSGEQLAAGITATGVETRFIKTDLADVEQARNSVLETVAAFGQLDCAVNAAGLTTRGTMLDTTPELFDAHMAVNLKSPFFVMAETIKHLRSRGVPGSILNVISIAELGGQPYLAPYVAAKAGLAGVTRNAAHAHRWDKIRINGLDIGWTATDGEAETQKKFHGAGDDWLEKANASVPMGKLGQVDEIAEFIVFLLSDRSGVVTGSVIDWDQNVLGGSD
ncbi:SDR family oxidoreductase [Arthrobacter sp. cf158]|uniref:SDR family oxidoreductase n=1 Tax=Arthrobacter sp. cf158 TaxID=1761744 RepID=UPI001C317CCE|nr:SDR family oxidoreductase [Arthrobacter sp. cf158]